MCIFVYIYDIFVDFYFLFSLCAFSLYFKKWGGLVMRFTFDSYFYLCLFVCLMLWVAARSKS